MYDKDNYPNDKRAAIEIKDFGLYLVPLLRLR